ncbi:MAG: 1-phosphofructokinase family hexose kinase [Lentisphaerae bacterium]|nr:1-phosphofructokinase family hexose kinase [Lentisphaerota bacterium]
MYTNNAHMCSFSTITLAPAEDICFRLASFPKPGDVIKVSAETVTPGGKGLNVARWLSGRGHNVRASGLLGSDNEESFMEMMAEYGIEDFMKRIDGATRANAMFVSPEGMFKINKNAFPNLSDNDWSYEQLVKPCIEGSDICILAGSLPYNMPQDAYAEIIVLLRSAGVTAVLDTSGEALKYGVAVQPCMIKPNREECSELLKRSIASDEDFRDAALELLDSCECVIISDGAGGSWFGFRELLCKSVYHVSSPEVEVLDTTAAGDALLAEFCHHYFPGRQVSEEAMRYASAAGAAATTVYGAEYPPISQVEQLARYVNVRKLS